MRSKIPLEKRCSSRVPSARHAMTRWQFMAGLSFHLLKRYLKIQCFRDEVDS